MKSGKRLYIVACLCVPALLLWATVVRRSAASMCSSETGSPPGFSAIVKSNLIWIGTALYTYINEYPSGFPPHLSMIYPHYLENPSAFWNPGDTDPCPMTIDNDIPDGPNSAEVSFQYFSGTANDPMAIVLEDRSLTYNGGHGLHVLLSNLNVWYLTPSATTLPSAEPGRVHLEQIGQALDQYAQDHQGHYPPALSALYPSYISDPLVFWNPGDNSGASPPTTISNDLPNKPDSAQISFSYLGAGHTTADDPGLVLIEDNSPVNNGGAIVNIRTIGVPAKSYLQQPVCQTSSACKTLAQTNLRQIAIALSGYASSNQDAFPTRLSMLDGYWAVTDPTMFWNPGDSNPRPLFIDNDLPENDNSTQISYDYFGGTADFNAGFVVMQDSSLANNRGDGFLVMTADSHVEFFVKSIQTLPNTAVARSHLQQIDAALHAYANANSGQFPLLLSQLFPAHISDPAVFWNPGDPQGAPSTINNDNIDKPNSARISFHYRGFAYNSASPPGAVLVEDNSLANNSGSGILVLTADGTVDFYVPEIHPCVTPNSCISPTIAKLNQIGFMLFVSTNETLAILPPTLSSLYPQYVSRPTDFWDAADIDPQPTAIDNDVPDQINSAQISFRYLAAGQNLNQIPTSTVLLRDSTIADQGGNVTLEYRADGQIHIIPLRTLTQIAISGPDTVTQGQEAHYLCTGTYSDATTQDLTAVSWWYVQNGQGTFIEPGGYLAPASVSTELTVTFQVYTDDYSAPEKTASKTITIVQDSDCDSVADSTDLCPNTVPGAAIDSNGCPPIIFGDADHDGDVDTADLLAFNLCRSRTGVLASESCAPFDRDGDGDVDMNDFGVFQRCYSGSDRPANPNCAN